MTYHDDWRETLIRSAIDWAYKAEAGHDYKDKEIPVSDGDPAVRGAAMRTLHKRGMAVEPSIPGYWRVVRTLDYGVIDQQLQETIR
jgi:hypothetical protein